MSTTIPGRIAVLSHSHPSLSKGGSEIAAYALFNGLQSLGADPIFVAACAADRRGDLYLDGPDEHVLFYDTADYSHFYHIGSPALVDSLVDLLKAKRCDVVNFHHFLNFGMNAVQHVAAQGFRTVVTLHEYLAMCHHYGQMVTRPDMQLCSRAAPSKCHRCYPELSPQQFEQRRRWMAETFDAVDRFVSPSQFLARRFVDWGLRADKISVLENGLTPKAAGGAAQRHRDPGSPWVFGYFGQINPFKGMNLLLDLADLLESDESASPIVIRAHGNMVGQSAEFLARFEKARLGRVLDYFGPYDNEEVLILMGQCDYVVIPSLWWENSPVVIQEAFAAGRPVIASGIGGMAEKITDGVSGLHFRVGSASDLKRVMQTAANPEVAERLRANLPQPIDQVTMAQNYLDLLASAT